MESLSPTVTLSTNRGGRPKDWTPKRVRQFIRLYLGTKLSVKEILTLLEEPRFKPRLEAANKAKHGALGCDPRFLRPKNENEVESQYRGLRQSDRGRRSALNIKAGHQTYPDGTALSEPSGLLPAWPEDASLADTTVAHSDHSLAGEEEHDFAAYRRAPDQTLTSRFFRSMEFGPNSRRQDSGLTTSTDVSVASTLLRKLHKQPLKEVKRAMKILKRFTFPKDSESRPDPIPETDLQPHNGDTDDRFSAAYAVPGDFLNSDLFNSRQQCATESPSHALRMCWCRIADQVMPSHHVWASLTPPFLPSNPALSYKDAFGNTAFHYLAAQVGNQDSFVELVGEGLRVGELPLRHLNTAFQTFLHVLHPSWFQGDSKLGQLLHLLRDADFNLLATDVYGRTFFHAFQAKMSASTYSELSSQLGDWGFTPGCRDAFGTEPMVASSVLNDDGDAGHKPENETSDASPEVALLRVITNAVGVDPAPPPGDWNPCQYYPDPRIEDLRGCNGMHCLAEATLELHQDTPRIPPMEGVSDTPASKSTKHEHQAEPTISARRLKRTHSTIEQTDISQLCSESRRVQILKGLILAGVNANHYDKQGYTPLMAFVVHSKDRTKAVRHDIDDIIKSLVNEAGANLESRNRNGETAVFLAARHGKMYALDVLLRLGARANTRNAQGLSMLELLDRLYISTENDVEANARYEACRAIATRKPQYAIQSPTIMDEWAIRSFA
ncbi:hypothetical protein F5Y17DRAFT_432013 [Xylariaceae sp. FL0594]|nr:hypothetical protein F5Y17DRAFT_432013 [Xylariaceae sp. FL0594]